MKINKLASSIMLLCGMSAASISAQAAPEWKPGVPRTAFATLFEWSWDSIAKECTNVLGPKGYAAVQVSPPQEHGPGPEWWRRYQPVSYQLVSRSGNRAQFQNMVNTCKNAGVDVYVDVVINHMADYFGGTGTAGSSWSGRNFPAVPYTAQDFHSPKCDIETADYNNNRADVMNCDMPGLPDLNTGSSYVQGKIAAYLNDLLSLGVAGFRVDAAKHIAPSEIAAIKARVPGAYFFTQEVIRDGTVGSATSGDLLAYQNIGTVNEFNYIYAMKNSFMNLEGFNLSRLPEIFNTWGFMPSDKATVFVNNHDTERKMCNTYNFGGLCDSLSTLNGNKLYLAHIFMLAYTYGYPSVASGYYFNDHDVGPQGQPYNGTETTPSNCSNSYVVGKWDCVHRERRVANMVGFRNYTAGQSLSNWTVGDVNQIAFSRGNRGFIAINNSGNTWSRTFTTGLADGTYCNILASDNPETGNCGGAEVVVSGGQATVTVNAGSAVAMHVGAKKTVVTDTTAPSVPASPAASNITSSGATISWTASTDTGGSGLAGYRVYRGATLVGSPTTTSFTDTSAAASTSYTYTVRAIDGAGNLSAASTGVAVTTKPVTANSVTVYYYRTDWSAANVHYGINGSWTPVPGVAMTLACTNYWRHTINLGSATGAAVVFNNNAGVWDNNNNLNYNIGTGTVMVKGGVVTANASNPCVTDTVAPSVPASVTRGTVTSNSVALSWAASTDNTGGSGMAGYRIYRNGVLVGTVAGTSYTDTGLTASTTYSYTVRAYDKAGNTSAASTAVSATTLAQPTGVTITFKINATTSMGENVYIVGNQAVLGNWSTAADASRKCSPTAYPVWTCTVTFPTAGAAIEYKYIKLGLGTKWESGSNRLYTLPSVATTKDDGLFRN